MVFWVDFGHALEKEEMGWLVFRPNQKLMACWSFLVNICYPQRGIREKKKRKKCRMKKNISLSLMR